MKNPPLRKRFPNPLRLGILLWVVCCYWHCASPHYVGYHETPHRKYGLVSIKTERAAKGFEKKCVAALLSGNVPELQLLMSKSLYQRIGADSVKILAKILKERNQITGKYFITNNQLNLKRSLFDREAKTDGFKNYDYIMVKYIIEGFPESYLFMFMKKIGDFYKLCGLRLQDLEYSETGRRLDLSWMSL